MSLAEIRSSVGDSTLPPLRCDICIVGSGPAGVTLAESLSGTKLRVILLESGTGERSNFADSLNQIENVGRPRAEQWAVRNRILGGSSHTWGGRCGDFDDIDFEMRDWVPHSGWPFDRAHMEPYLDRSARYLGLAQGSGYSDERFWQFAGRHPPDNDLDKEVLIPFFWQFSRDPEESYPYEYRRFGRNLDRKLGSNITLVTGATVLKVHIEDTSNSVKSVEFATQDGHSKLIAAPVVILCCGGVENARILLNSDSQNPRGLGNDYDQVGRYLMDHLRGPIGSFDVSTTAALQKRYGRYNVDGRFFRAGFRLSPTVQRRERLLNCASWLGEIRAPDDPWDALRRIVGGAGRLPSDVFSVVSNSNLLVRGIKDHFAEKNGVPRKLSALTLECMIEQVPNPDSRVTLSEKRDHLGMRLPKVDWRSSVNEARSMHAMAHLTAGEFARLGLPIPQLEQWVLDKADLPDSFVDVAHPTGTTRMSAEPSSGVVDENCQVHGVPGLYVSGSSVFPTAGHCNPTQMIVAMAVRLSDHLVSNASAGSDELSARVLVDAV